MGRRVFAWAAAAVLAVTTGQAAAGTLAVTSSADSGPGSLRDALSRVRPGDRIVLGSAGEGGKAGSATPATKIVLAAPLPPIAATLVLELRAAAPNVTISGGALTLEARGGLSLDISSGRSLTLDVPIAGAEGDRGLVVAGGGALVLAQPGDYRGGTTVTGATLELDGAGGLPPKGRLVLMGGRFELGPRDATLGMLSGDDGTIMLGARTLTVDQDADSKFQGVIEGAGRFVKTGAGRLVLGTGIGWTGGTEVNGGVLELAGSGPAAQIHGPITLNGGTLVTSGVRLGSGSGQGPTR